MRFVTFNICGINNVLGYHPWNEQRSFEHMFSVLQADVICLQETKLQPHLLKREHCLVPGYDSYWSFSSTKKGYSGVVVYVKHGIGVLRAEEGITGQLLSPDSKKGLTYQQLYHRQKERDGASKSCIGGYPEGDPQRLYQIDSEGRSVLLDLGFCVLFGLYCPSTATEGEERDAYREDYFALLEERVNLLVEAGREVVVMGDLNVARELYDSAEGMQALHKVKQITLPSLGDKEEGRFVDAFERLNPAQCAQWRSAKTGRRVFHRLVPSVLQDSCRDKHPNRADMYTCWNVMLNYRPGNFGSRIDYVLASKGLHVDDADILPHLEGSDHCPVYAVIRDKREGESESSASISTAPNSTSSSAPKTRPKLFHRTDRQFQTGSVVSMFRAQTPPVTSKVAKPKAKPAKKQSAISAFFQKPAAQAHTTPLCETQNIGSNEGSQDVEHSTEGFVQSSVQSLEHAAEPGGEFRRDEEEKEEKDEKKENEDKAKKELKEDSFEDDFQDLVERAEKAEKVASQWTRIMAKKPAPVCDHNLPAVLRTTRKKGPNQGKHFWVCGQNHSLQLVDNVASSPDQGSASPASQDAHAPQDDSTTRCNFFQWK
ncbi:DNA-(apurinic or apyrimidinic site) lyase 2 [Yarrowia sp. B02]|nr:DNA-(apurinic or apyrimidinic site) lyase 2 [Yarrowia sp. B02]